jgi:hypothetical protein
MGKGDNNSMAGKSDEAEPIIEDVQIDSLTIKKPDTELIKPA